jgi:NAD(P)-dependent dehydrogenase (short-subunit alcohol dehydrogenase family)
MVERTCVDWGATIACQLHHVRLKLPHVRRAVATRARPPGARPLTSLESAMSTVFITGSADGLGAMAARRLIAEGHEVVLHARSEQRAQEAMEAVPGAAAALHGDLSSIEQIRGVAEQAQAHGTFDAVIHNAGVGYRESRRIETADGLSHLFAINVLAPYLLTSLMTMPQRLVYLSSGMHRGGDPSTDDLQWSARRWQGAQAYSDSKLFDTVLALAVARLHPELRSNAVDPGWVPTKMGGAGAPGDLDQGDETQAWLAVSDDPAADATGRLFYHLRPTHASPAASDIDVQDRLLDACQALTGEPI